MVHVASPEVCDDEDGHQQGAEGDGVADGVHHIQPSEEALLGGNTRFRAVSDGRQDTHRKLFSSSIPLER